MPAELMTFERVQPYWHGFFSDKVFFTYRRCTACALLHAKTYFSGDQLQDLYREMTPNMSVVDDGALRRTARDYFAVLKRHTRAQGTYLEIGPDAGTFASLCAEDGNFDEYRLFEPNEAVHPELRRAVAGHVHHVDHYFAAGAVPDSSVDVAVMIHVLDHVLEPVSLVSDVRRTLRRDGALFLVTHDERSLLARILGARWPAYCLQHPQLFNPKTMAKTLTRAGFRRVRTVRSTNYFPLTFLLRQLLLAARLPAPAVPELPWLRVGLRLGNFITIAEV